MGRNSDDSGFRLREKISAYGGIEMHVNIETQYLCVDQKYIRGIPYYIICLLKELYQNNNNRYTVSFCDRNRERNNRAYIENTVGKFMRSEDILESNDLDYRWISSALRSGDTSTYDHKCYGDYFGIKADVYHFPSSLCIPQNVHAPTVVTVHDMIPVIPTLKHELKGSVVEEFRASQEYIRASGAICICPSVATKNDLQEYFDVADENIFVVPQGFSSKTLWIDKNENILRELNISEPFILYLGALDPRKGGGDILNAYDIICKKHDIQLVLAGSGEKWAEEVLYPAIDKSEYKKNIILPGYVTEEQKRVLLSSASIFLFPSEYEGFGIPILEAMTCGTPVITTNVSSIPEVGGDGALYVTPHQPEELAQAVDTLLGDDSLMESLRQKSLERSKRFTWKNTAEMTENVYQIAAERGI